MTLPLPPIRQHQTLPTPGPQAGWAGFSRLLQTSLPLTLAEASVPLHEEQEAPTGLPSRNTPLPPLIPPKSPAARQVISRVDSIGSHLYGYQRVTGPRGGSTASMWMSVRHHERPRGFSLQLCEMCRGGTARGTDSRGDRSFGRFRRAESRDS